MSKYAAKAIACVYRAMEQEVESGNARNMIILTHPEDSASVGKSIAGLLPPGSVCTGSVWTSPDGRTLSIKRYTDPVPDYKTDYKMVVCNGGRAMTREDGKNLDRWRAGGPSPIPIVAP